MNTIFASWSFDRVNAAELSHEPIKSAEEISNEASTAASTSLSSPPSTPAAAEFALPATPSPVLIDLPTPAASPVTPTNQETDTPDTKQKTHAVCRTIEQTIER